MIIITAVNWKKLLSKSVEDADVLSKISSHQKRLDALEDFEGQIFVDGESYNTDTLKLLYLVALDNICSNAVLDFLASLSVESTRDGLINEVFLDMAIEQHKKTRFINQLKKLLNRGRAGDEYSSEFETPPSLCQYAVENALMDMGLELRLNLVTKRVEVGGYGAEALYECHTRANVLNVLPSLIYDSLKADGVKGLNQGIKMIERYLFNIADSRSYNPIHEMFEQYENDSRENLDSVIDMLGIDDDFDELLVTKWLVQCVALAYNDIDNPTCSEGVLVLQGPQGCGKTSFFRRMALRPDWFTEGAVIDVRSKDSLITALSTWICELGEIDCTLMREQSALKAFITRPLDRIRFPYAAAESEMARTTSLCGTVNPDKFLNDLTGARRYWVINVERIDKKRLFNLTAEEIRNMWGYVYNLYKKCPDSFRLDDDQRERLEKRNRKHNCELKYEAEVRDLLDFSIDEKYWKEVNPAKLAGFLGKVSAIQVGKILSKIADDDDRVKVINAQNRKTYTLPLKKTVFDTMKSYIG